MQNLLRSNRLPRMRLCRLGSFLMLVLFLMLACGKEKSQGTSEDAYVQEIRSWHQKRLASLTRPDGWLTLVGLHWLKEGENTFGSDSSNQIVFPPAAPPFIGSFYLQNGRVSVKIRPGITITTDSVAVSSLVLRNDTEGKPTILRYGSLQWYIIKRGERFGVRIKDSNSPVRRNFRGIELFPINKKWRVKARFEPYDPPKTISVPTVLGTISEARCPGRLVFQIEGKTYSLDPIQEPGDQQFFLIFADETNGTETYGAGRFLAVDLPDSNGITYIDFNKAYNPPCAFTPYATCPLPPDQNYLTIAVTAGEKRYAGSHH